MAFDGITMAALCHELSNTVIGGRLSKISQTEADELLLTIKGNSKDPFRLLISVDPSLPYLCYTSTNKPAPLTAPAFCMMLRKHIANGRILSIRQPNMDRILIMTIEHLSELGDLCTKDLIIELMGKHSNIIFTNPDTPEKSTVLDSIKRVPPSVSSLRTVLPGTNYYLPDQLKRLDPLGAFADGQVDMDYLLHTDFFTEAVELSKRLYTFFSGLSPAFANHVLLTADIDPNRPANTLSEAEKIHLSHRFVNEMQIIYEKHFDPVIYYRKDEPVEFSAVMLQGYEDCEVVHFASISEVIERFYTEKSIYSRIRSKSTDLRKNTHTALERNLKKYDLQLQQMKDTEKREKYRLHGELLTAYAYSLPENAKEVTVEDYYSGKEITIQLQPEYTVKENAKRFYDKYNKYKRMYEALTLQIAETQSAIEHLESIELALSIAKTEEDLRIIAEELSQSGYLKKHPVKNGKKNQKTTIGKPMHYISSDGFDIYVGKNNFQNEYLTFELAGNNDFWFHAKGIPGSHVIVKTNGRELPDRVYEEAGALAAYYSKGRDNDKVEIDYIQKKHIKKPPKAAPGFVIYHTNYSLMAFPNIKGLKEE